MRKPFHPRHLRLAIIRGFFPASFADFSWCRNNVFCTIILINKQSRNRFVYICMLSGCICTLVDLHLSPPGSEEAGSGSQEAGSGSRESNTLAKIIFIFSERIPFCPNNIYSLIDRLIDLSFVLLID